MPLDAQLLTLLAYVTLLALFVSAVVIGLKRTAQRFEIRRIELAALRRAARTPADRFLPEDQARFPLLHPVGIGLALSCGLGLAHYTPLAPVIHRATTDAGFGASGFRLVFQLALVVMVLWAYRLHWMPDRARRAKYQVVLSGLMAYFVATSFEGSYNDVLVSEAPEATFATLDPDTARRAHGFGAVAGLVPAVVFLALQRLATYLVPPGREAPRWSLHLAQSRVLFAVGILLFMPLLIALCLFRYPVLERERMHPILYFRAFSHGLGPRVFAEVVAPACSGVGVVEALMHEHQLASDVQLDVSVQSQGRFATATEEDWRDWVLAQLGRARAVIVDVGGGSSNVVWELQTAIEALGPARVVAIAPEDEVSKLESSGAVVHSYGTTRRSLRETRRALRRWLEHLPPRGRGTHAAA